jgi:Cys-tRNA(Pro)/Cys-tRNA(Cys) deacylase
VAGRETPATKALDAAGIACTVHEYAHDPKADSYAGEAAEALGLDARPERVTGYVRGGISPLGQRRALATYVDETAYLYDTIFVSAGRRGLEIEITPDDLIELTNAVVKGLCAAP